MNLVDKRCTSCESGTMPLSKSAAEEFLKQTLDWQLSEDSTRISKKFKFKNFKDALAFVNEVGHIAEAEVHHPDIILKWGKVEVELSTHAIKGLSENDFILAAKIDTLN